AGITFVNEMQTRTGSAPPDAARAYLIVREAFKLRSLWAEIEELDSKVAARSQLDILIEITGLIEQAAAWLLRRRRLDFGREIAKPEPSIRSLATALSELLPEPDKNPLAERPLRLREASVPEALAARLARLIFLASSLDIDELAEGAGQPLDHTAR